MTGDVRRCVMYEVDPIPNRAGQYNVIVADPPWTFKTYSAKGKGRSAEAHYNCMSLADIKSLPVAEWAAPDCALFLWATDPLLPKALEVIDSWGFVYKTVGFTWVKTTKDGKGFRMGLEPVLTVNSETLLDNDKLRLATGEFPYKNRSWNEYSKWLAPLLARVEERFE
jgi:hypothetical protein